MVNKLLTPAKALTGTKRVLHHILWWVAAGELH